MRSTHTTRIYTPLRTHISELLICPRYEHKKGFVGLPRKPAGEQAHPSCCASVIPVKSHFLLDNSHCSPAWCPISCLPSYPSDPLINITSEPEQMSPGSSPPFSPRCWYRMRKTKNDIFLCRLTSGSSSLKTKEHLKVAGRRHIFSFSVYSKKPCWPFLFFSFFFFSFFHFSGPWFRLEMSDHYSANANLSGWMWRLKP